MPLENEQNEEQTALDCIPNEMNQSSQAMSLVRSDGRLHIVILGIVALGSIHFLAKWCLTEGNDEALGPVLSV